MATTCMGYVHMELYTYQIAHWRVVKALGDDITILDTTVKSGYSQLAPTWDMVMAIKQGRISEEKYTRLYHRILDYSRRVNPGFWAALLRLEKVAIGCYCPGGKFCHRHLLAAYLGQLTSVKHVAEISG